MTINEALQLMKQLKQRIKELDALRLKVSVEENIFSSKEKEVRPLYDVKKVDKKITALQEIEFRLNAAIKERNATVVIAVELDKIAAEVFEPLQ